MQNKVELHRISEVVEKGLCVSCGACVLAAGSDAISWEFDAARGQYLPKLRVPESPADEGIAFEICPGKGVDIIRLGKEISAPDATYDQQLGYLAKIQAVRSIDSRILAKASSGGIITTAALHLLSTGRVTGILATRFTYTPSGPRPEPVIARNLDQLLECQGSKYCPVSIQDALAPLKGTNERVAFIGTPCQIEALRMMMARSEWLRDRIAFVIGSFCGGIKDFRELDTLIRRQGIDPSQVVRFSFRGEGQPGKLTIEDASGQVRTRPYPDYVTDTGFKKLDRCRLCVDGTAELADLACGDAWLPRFLGSGKTWSVALARNEKASELLAEMKAQGLIEVQEISLDEVKHSQRANLASKKTRQAARRKLYNSLGRALPVFDGGFPEKVTSVKLELKVYLSHSFLSGLEAVGLYRPFIKFARWIRGTNEFKKTSSTPNKKQ